jgi:hypothetical protein
MQLRFTPYMGKEDKIAKKKGEHDKMPHYADIIQACQEGQVKGEFVSRH